MKASGFNISAGPGSGVRIRQLLQTLILRHYYCMLTFGFRDQGMWFPVSAHSECFYSICDDVAYLDLRIP